MANLTFLSFSFFCLFFSFFLLLAIDYCLAVGGRKRKKVAQSNASVSAKTSMFVVGGRGLTLFVVYLTVLARSKILGFKLKQSSCCGEIISLASSNNEFIFVICY